MHWWTSLRRCCLWNVPSYRHSIAILVVDPKDCPAGLFPRIHLPEPGRKSREVIKRCRRAQKSQGFTKVANLQVQDGCDKPRQRMWQFACPLIVTSTIRWVNPVGILVENWHWTGSKLRLPGLSWGLCSPRPISPLPSASSPSTFSTAQSYYCMQLCIHAYIRTYVQTDRQTDRKTDKQTNIHTYISMKPRDDMPWNLKPLDSIWPCWGHNQFIKVFRNLHLRPPSPLHASKPRQSSESPKKSRSDFSNALSSHSSPASISSASICPSPELSSLLIQTQGNNTSNRPVTKCAKGDFQYEIKLGVGSPTTWRCRSRASQFRLPTSTQLEDWTGSEETSPQPVSLQGNAPEMLRNDDLESCLLKFVEPARSQFLEGIKASRHLASKSVSGIESVSSAKHPYGSMHWQGLCCFPFWMNPFMSIVFSSVSGLYSKSWCA